MLKKENGVIYQSFKLHVFQCSDLNQEQDLNTHMVYSGGLLTAMCGQNGHLVLMYIMFKQRLLTQIKI